MIRTFVSTLLLIGFCLLLLAVLVGPVIVGAYLFGMWAIIALPFSIAGGVTLMEWFVNSGFQRLIR